MQYYIDLYDDNALRGVFERALDQFKANISDLEHFERHILGTESFNKIFRIVLMAVIEEELNQTDPEKKLLMHSTRIIIEKIPAILSEVRGAIQHNRTLIDGMRNNA